MKRILFSILEVLPVTVLISLIIFHFRIFKKPGNRFLSFIMPLGISFIVLVLGYHALHLILPEKGGFKAAPARYLSAGKFNDFEERVVYLDSLDNNRLQGVLSIEKNNSERKFTYYSEGLAEAGEDELKLLIQENKAITLTPKPVYDSIFRQDIFVFDFIQDIHAMNREIKSFYIHSKKRFYLFCFSLVFSFLSIGVFLRISRWPLFNVLLGFLVMRLFFYLFRFLRDGITLELEKILENQAVIQFLPFIILLLFGALMFIIDFLFIPFDMWKREIKGE